METEKRIHCIQALPVESGSTGLFDPKAFTPVELRRMALCQINRKREIHILEAVEGGVNEIVLDFARTNLPRRDISRSAMISGELMELSDGFYFQIPSEE